MKSYCGKVGEFINFVNSEIRKSFARSIREHERHVSDMKSGCIQDSRQKEPLCEKKYFFLIRFLGIEKVLSYLQVGRKVTKSNCINCAFNQPGAGDTKSHNGGSQEKSMKADENVMTIPNILLSNQD